jgi:hypothetical protein
MPSSDGHETCAGVLVQGFLVLWPLRGCNGHLASRVSGVDNTELDNGKPVRSRRREYGCGNQWQSDVMASYDCDTDADEVQRFKELITLGEERERLSVPLSMLAIAVGAECGPDTN